MTTKTTIKAKWTVGEAPTGRYKSFFHRSWPSATIGGKAAIMLQCNDAYTARAAASGTHAPLTVRVADYRAAQNTGGGAFTWRKLKGTFATLAAAKEAGEKFFAEFPSVLER